MWTFDRKWARGGVLAWAMVIAVGGAAAFEIGAPQPSGRPAVDSAAQRVFRDGLAAYYNGNRAQSLKLLDVAADAGLPEAQWKLGRIYAEGDGVKVNEGKAFEYFSRLVALHGDEERTSPLAPYVANAFTQLGIYCLHGIKASKMPPDPERGMRMLYIAANNFGDPEAQYRLGLMYRDGEGVPRDPRRAAQWLLWAAKKGQVGAQAALGGMLVEGQNGFPARPVEGLKWLTIALRRVIEGRAAADVRMAHERAFSELDDEDRAKAVELAERWLAEHPASGGDAPAAANVAAVPGPQVPLQAPPLQQPVTASAGRAPVPPENIPNVATRTDPAMAGTALTTAAPVSQTTIDANPALGLLPQLAVPGFGGQGLAPEDGGLLPVK